MGFGFGVGVGVGCGFRSGLVLVLVLGLHLDSEDEGRCQVRHPLASAVLYLSEGIAILGAGVRPGFGFGFGVGVGTGVGVGIGVGVAPRRTRDGAKSDTHWLLPSSSSLRVPPGLGPLSAHGAPKLCADADPNPNSNPNPNLTGSRRATLMTTHLLGEGLASAEGWAVPLNPNPNPNPNPNLCPDPNPRYWRADVDDDATVGRGPGV